MNFLGTILYKVHTLYHFEFLLAYFSITEKLPSMCAKFIVVSNIIFHHLCTKFKQRFLHMLKKTESKSFCMKLKLYTSFAKPITRTFPIRNPAFTVLRCRNSFKIKNVIEKIESSTFIVLLSIGIKVSNKSFFEKQYCILISFDYLSRTKIISFFSILITHCINIKRHTFKFSILVFFMILQNPTCNLFTSTIKSI